MKKYHIVLCVLILVLLFTSCRQKETDMPDVPEEQNYETEVSDTQSWPIIRMEVCSFTEQQTREQEIENALNAYLVSIDAGVQADLVSIPTEDRQTQLELMLSDATNPIDLYCWRWFSTVTELVEKEQCISLEKYRSLYPDLWELFPKDIYDTCKVNGEQYSIPSADSFGNFGVYALRADIAQELGIEARHGDRMSLDELMIYLKQAKGLHPELCFQVNLWSNPVLNIDDLGDNHALGVLAERGTDPAGTVINLYEDPSFYEFCMSCKEMEEQGLFLDDPLNHSLAGASLVNEGLCGGFLFEAYSCDYARQLMQTQCPNDPMVVFQLTDPGCDNSCVYNGWQISSVCTHPDAAMKLLYLAFTDEHVSRYLAMGIEDVTYQVDAQGCAWYADGVTAENVGWNMSAPWFYPNMCLCLPLETEYAAYYTDMVEFWYDPQVRYSAALGFVFDSSAVSEEVRACSTVIDEYRPALLTGQVDVESYLKRMNQELHDHGIDRIIAEKQKQLDAFLQAEEEE